MDKLPSLAIDFCGIHCENPFFLASSAVSTNYEMVASALEAGWGGVYYKTICTEDIHEVSPRFDAVRNEHESFVGFRNMEQLSENSVSLDLDIMRRLKKNYPTKVVIASIMGTDEADWIKLAREVEKAGVDAIELNFSCPQMRMAGMGSDVGRNPELVSTYTDYVKRNVSIPVIAKMTPNLAAMTNVAFAAHLAGADGISAINTIKSVTLNNRSAVSTQKTISGYSGRAVKPIALRFILEIANNPLRKKLELSGIGGIESWWDALDFIRLGCANVQVCTAVMQYGQRIIDDLKLGLQNYMLEKGVTQLKDLVGTEIHHFVTPAELDRDTIVFPKFHLDKCIGCGRCHISCQDGGHQAIIFGEDRRPRLNGAKCVGCHLCRLICPTGAIDAAKRIPKPKSR
jgi:dihydropyrimidine dehydrogenase (NAD+) subunit PreA